MDINGFILTCESNVIDVSYFSTSDIVEESVKDKISSGIKWLIERGKTLLEKFITWARGILSKLFILINGEKLKKELKNKCRNDKQLLYSFIEDLESKIIKLSFSGLTDITKLIDNQIIFNITSDIDNYTKDIISGNSKNNYRNTDDINKFINDDLPKINAVISKGFTSNKDALQKLDDEADVKKSKFKESDTKAYEYSIHNLLSNYKQKMSKIEGYYKRIKTSFNKIQASLQLMNRELDTLKRKSDAGEIMDDAYSAVSKNVSNISSGINATVLSHNAYMSSIAKCSSVYTEYIDRLTYGIDPNSKEANNEIVGVPSFTEMQNAANKINNSDTDSIPVKTVYVNGTKTNIWVTTIFNSAYTIFGSIKSNEILIYQNSKDLKLTKNGCTVVMPCHYYIGNNAKTPKEADFILYHELGHVSHKDFKIGTSDSDEKKMILKAMATQTKINILHRYNREENNADLYAAKNTNMSKNEFEKNAVKNLTNVQKQLLDDQHITDKRAVDANMGMMKHRTDYDQKNFNKSKKQ